MANRAVLLKAPARAPGPFTAHRTLLTLLAAGALLRIFALSAFPEVQADEGLWTNSAKNFVEFGDWFMDGRTHLFLSPLFSGLAAISFWLLGPSIAAARLISAVAGVASVALLYAVVARACRDRRLALVAAAVLGLNQWSVIQSREALVESLQVALCLASLYVALGERRWSAAAAGVVFGLALLAKTNAIFLAPVLAAYLFLRTRDNQTQSYTASLRSPLLFLGVALAIAGSVYATLYFAYPGRFVQAFRFELDGIHFEQLSHPLIRVGRFGLDPEQAARTILALVREAPFLIVLAALGAGVWSVRRPPGSAVFALWLVVGLAFFLCQLFQPLRYFQLLSPPLAVAAALAILEFGRATLVVRTSRRSLPGVALAICISFELLYLAASAFANRARLLPAIVPWVTTHVPRDASIMAAGYVCTDLPNRAYAHYWLARTPEQLLENVRELQIRYLIVDSREWAPSLREEVARRFGPPLQSWRFGAVYAINDSMLTVP
ncbi:MAG TPA: glycosyltransferase family 39 protein [Gemmatimonadales bacterium]|nr:glycosyltransferase family 39 protein [Gemmatimonadales bacterium]